MSYQVLARKWRPQSFDDVYGQAHVTTPLRNAIRSDRVRNAVAADRIAQRGRNVGLAGDLVETLGAPLAREDFVGHRGPAPF